MVTIVYTDGGKDYLGRLPDQSVTEWNVVGWQIGFKWTYIGTRNYQENVVVYSQERLSAENLAMRRANGFMDIKEYKVVKPSLFKGKPFRGRAKPL